MIRLFIYNMRIMELKHSDKYNQGLSFVIIFLVFLLLWNILYIQYCVIYCVLHVYYWENYYIPSVPKVQL